MRQNQKIRGIDPELLGSLYGFVGVFDFSLTLPATRAAVKDEELEINSYITLS